MTTNANTIDAQPEAQTMSSWLTLLFAAACGLIVANIYYAQPLAGPIGASLGLTPAATGLIVTLTQMGYGAGLLFIVPLGDLIENRRLTVGLVVLACLAMLGAALAGSPTVFLISAGLIGLSSVGVQVLLPMAAHMAPEASRGRVVGNVMSGLMLGIMLARPVASFIANASSWHTVFYGASALMLLVGVLLALTLPTRMPTAQLRYSDLLASMWRLMLNTPVLRRRALYHAGLFAAFSLFWTTTPLLLAGPLFHLSQGGIAWFALAGVAGAVASPIAGRVADRGWSRPATAIAITLVALAFLITRIAHPGSNLALGILVGAGIMLDFGVSMNMTLSQRAIFSLGAEYRARLNGVYMTTFFIGGALGSAVGGWAYAQGGWPWASAIGIGLPVLVMAYFATES
jgi:predicted MFS family arabinose efflux permease